MARKPTGQTAPVTSVPDTTPTQPEPFACPYHSPKCRMADGQCQHCGHRVGGEEKSGDAST